MGLLKRIKEAMFGAGEEFTGWTIENILDAPGHEGAFMRLEDLYLAFCKEDLSYDDQMIIVPQNPNYWYPTKYGSAPYKIFDLGDDGKFPQVCFCRWGKGPIRYGEFMSSLQQKGRENGWDYPYYLGFDYSDEGDGDVSTCFPHYPVVEQDGNGDPRCFIVSSKTNDWCGPFYKPRGGLGGAAGL